MSEREQRVREIAHRLWEEEGRPSDQEKRHWATAERVFAAEEMAQTASASGTGKRRAARKSAKRMTAGPQTSAAQSH